MKKQNPFLARLEAEYQLKTELLRRQTNYITRQQTLDGVTKISPLHLIGWTEADCMRWCIENDLRSPTYDTSTRGGAGSVTTSGATNSAY